MVSWNRGTSKSSSISRWEFPWNKPAILGVPPMTLETYSISYLYPLTIINHILTTIMISHQSSIYRWDVPWNRPTIFRLFLWFSYGFPMLWGTPFKRLIRGRGPSPRQVFTQKARDREVVTFGHGRKRCTGELPGSQSQLWWLIWRFPEMGVPPVHHPFELHFPLEAIHLGVTPFMETSI